MRATPTCIAFSFACVCASFSAQPQQFISEHLTVEQGLPENSVWVIFQDSDGFLWISTQAGLARFDGYAFSRLGPTPVSSRNARPDLAGPIIESRDHRWLWIGSTAHGLYRFDRKTGTFTQAGTCSLASTATNRHECRSC